MRFSVACLLLLVVCSCRRMGTLPPKDALSDSIKVIDLLPLTDSIISNLYDIATDIRYLPLRTPQGIRISNIFKIVTCADKIYVNSGRNLACFDNNGNFLYALKQVESPDFIYDFDMSSDDITLVTLSDKKISVFRNTGTGFVLQNSIKLKRPRPSKISMVPGTNKILLSIIPSKGNETSLSMLMDIDGDTLLLKPNCYKFRKSDRMTYGSEDEIIHYKTGNYLCFKERFSDTIFCINSESDTFTPRLILDSKGKSYPAWARGNSENAEYILDEYSEVEEIFEIADFIFYNYSYVYRKVGFAWHRKILYDRRTNRKIEIELNKELKDDLSGGPDFYPTGASEGKLYSFIDASVLKFYISGEVFEKASVKYPDRKEDLRRLGDSLKNTDNPVLVIVRLKNN